MRPVIPHPRGHSCSRVGRGAAGPFHDWIRSEDSPASGSQSFRKDPIFQLPARRTACGGWVGVLGSAAPPTAVTDPTETREASLGPRHRAAAGGICPQRSADGALGPEDQQRADVQENKLGVRPVLIPG